ncbi:transcription factor ABORTED MICROSPORES-like isoform X2 [Aristolochia californica]|uniref:transcription factor ABORTED MICROSPORES-like isoform X2 n=1 Tax=Aristolochia californica TaxID=171875 RepID=UPI0035D61EA3
MKISQRCTEKLRPLVGIKSWDYCVIWTLSDDQKRIEWMDCCCGGAETSREEDDHHFAAASPLLVCKDVMFQHPRTKACNALDELPLSMALDSGNHTEALVTNKPLWLNLPSISSSDFSNATKVLIPVTSGLIELFVAKHVSEDHQIVEFVMAQCNSPSWDPNFHDQTLGSSALNDGFLSGNTIDHHMSKPFSCNGYSLKNTIDHHFQPWMQPATDNLSLPWGFPQDQIRLCNSPLNFLGNQQLDNIVSDKLTSFDSGIDHGLQEIVTLQPSIQGNNPSLHHGLAEYDKESVKQEMGRGDSLSDCSDQIEDDDDQKVASKSGRRNQSKNLVAERKRRKKLNDRLYALRALVPKITKMDRASILGDAIEFVKELQKQVKGLQDELEETPEEEAVKQNGNANNGQLDTQNQDAVAHGDNKSTESSGLVIVDQGTRCSSSNKTSDASKQNPDSVSNDDKGQQMEVQVEVSQVNYGNEFFVKIFCEHKTGGFVRLMEAMNSLGLEVTNANITTFRGLVLNVVKAEKRDSEIVQAEQIRESLLELTRNPTSGWSEPEATTEGGPADYQQQLHDDNHHHHEQQLNSHHLHHRHHCL